MFSRGPEQHGTGSLALAFSLRPLHVRVLLLLLAALLSLALGAVLRSPLHLFEEQVGALGWTLAPNTEPEQRVSVVAIDEKSIAQLGAWPWPRQTLAQLSTALQDYGVQLQLYDMNFPEAKEGDAEFIQALGATTAVLSQALSLNSDQAVRAGVLSHPLSGVACTAQSASASGYIGNDASFAAIAAGHMAPLVDGDGGVRQVPAYICVDGAAYPALA
ncbi:MAG: CHASE2 domain-containing protein, partial [Pseudomonadales bacterium]|nr:CHASE2 domain-containing protein [Pseudomonadales bacterium]